MEPISWGRHEKHLAVGDLLLAVHLRRASIEEVAAELHGVLPKRYAKQAEAIYWGPQLGRLVGRAFDREITSALLTMQAVNERMRRGGANPRRETLAFRRESHGLVEGAAIEHHDQGVCDFAIDLVKLELKPGSRSAG